MTSNGFCYTFNGESGTKIWRPSEVMDAFNHLFPHDNIKNVNFGGAGSVQGNINMVCQAMLKLKNIHGKKFQFLLCQVESKFYSTFLFFNGK